MSGRANVHHGSNRGEINDHVIVVSRSWTKRRFIASEARISLVWIRRDLSPDGRKESCVDGSDQITLSRLAVLLMTSISPGVAFGTRFWLSEGLRKSQSTRITRAPPCALSRAKDAAIVDLPSLGSDDVMPITLLDLAAPPRSTLTFTARIDSAKGESGESITYRSKPAFGAIILEAVGSAAALVLTGAALALRLNHRNDGHALCL